MALSIVNKMQHSPVTGGSATVKIGTSPTWTPTAGNLIVFAVSYGGFTSVSSVVDTLGNTYIAKTQQQYSDGHASRFYVCYNCKGGSANIITVTLSGTASYPVAYLWEISGAPTASDPTDVNTGTTFSGVGAGSTVTSPTFNTQYANEMGFAFIASNVGGQTWTSSNWTLDIGNLASSGGSFAAASHISYSSRQSGASTGFTQQVSVSQGPFNVLTVRALAQPAKGASLLLGVG